MFKLGSFEEELANSMQKNLVSSRVEHKVSYDKLSKAADYINAAAELLDDTGFGKEAEILTRVLEKLANGDQNDAQSSVHDVTNATLEALEEPDQDEVVMDPLEQTIASKEYLAFKSLAAKINKKKV